MQVNNIQSPNFGHLRIIEDSSTKSALCSASRRDYYNIVRVGEQLKECDQFHVNVSANPDNPNKLVCSLSSESDTYWGPFVTGEYVAEYPTVSSDYSRVNDAIVIYNKDGEKEMAVIKVGDKNPTYELVGVKNKIPNSVGNIETYAKLAKIFNDVSKNEDCQRVPGFLGIMAQYGVKRNGNK